MDYCLTASPSRIGTSGQTSGQAAAGHTLINRLLGAALTLLVMLILKQHYSTAAPGQLTWILAPTARLLEWLTPARPVWESGAGYADFSRGIIIAPACAGINFMIMSFGLAALCGLAQIRRLAPLLIWLVLGLAVAYGLTLAVNTLRITVSMSLYRAAIYSPTITPERVHRLAGVILYLCALGLYFRALHPIISSYCRRFDCQNLTAGPVWPAWLPAGWYLLGAVGVPTANLLFRSPAAGYGEHCVTVVLAVMVMRAAGWLAAWSNRRIVHASKRKIEEW